MGKRECKEVGQFMEKCVLEALQQRSWRAGEAGNRTKTEAQGCTTSVHRNPHDVHGPTPQPLLSPLALNVRPSKPPRGLVGGAVSFADASNKPAQPALLAVRFWQGCLARMTRPGWVIATVWACAGEQQHSWCGSGRGESIADESPRALLCRKGAGGAAVPTLHGGSAAW